MPKKVKKLWFTLYPDLDDLAVGVCQDNTYEEVIAFIRQIDTEQQDSVFTDMLYDLASELKREQDNA